MSRNITLCSMMRMAVDQPEYPFVYIAKFREIGIQILDGGSSYLVLNYCPWSGRKLPPSLRQLWFNQLEAKGVDLTADEIPDEFQDERWYQSLEEK